MKIALVGEGTLRAYKETEPSESAELVLFGFNGIEKVSYERELKGESTYFEDVALLSKRKKAVVVCGCITDTRGHARKSTVVAENGKLLGVSDMLNVVDGEVGAGAALRVYETKIGRMGVVVAEDLHFPDVVKALALCGSDFIVCPFGQMRDSMQTVLLRAQAYCYGVPIVLCGKGYAAIADAGGTLVFSSPSSPAYFSFENVREYHLVETRRRGIFRAGI